MSLFPRSQLLSASLIFGLLPMCAHAELAVIVNKSNDYKFIERSEIQNIYMGRQNTFADGHKARPIDQNKQSSEYLDFYKKLVSMSPTQLNTHWAKSRFNGKGHPPLNINGTTAVIEYVSTHKDAIAYIEGRDVTADVKVVFRLP